MDLPFNVELKFEVTKDQLIYAVAHSLFWYDEPRETKEDLYNLVKHCITQEGYSRLVDQSLDYISEHNTEEVEDCIKQATNLVNTIFN